MLHPRPAPPRPAPARQAPIGARGPPSGPRSDLSRADTGAVPHAVYVKVVTPDDPDRKSREITLQVLQYVHSRLPVFAQMGLAVQVNKIRSQDLRNARLVEAMRRRGIHRLPALTTPNGVYLGFKEISDVYERNIKEYMAVGRRDDKPAEGAVLEDELADYYRDEMTFERAEEDTGEEGIGESDDMMDSYRRMMERREQAQARRKPTGLRPPADPQPDRRGAPPLPAASPRMATRPDNIAQPRGAARPADDDDDIQATIDRLAREIDSGTRSKAFEAGGGDSYDDTGGPDPQDDLMESAYWANMEGST